MDEELYQEQILEHYKHPLHKEIMSTFSFTYHDLNPLCGDDITIYGKINKDKKITLSFMGHGCAISQASASLLIDSLQHKTIQDIEKLTPESIYTLLGIKISPGRVKCALLSLNTLKKGLEVYKIKQEKEKEETAKKENTSFKTKK